MSRRVSKPFRVYAKKDRPGVWEIWETKDGKNVLVPREKYKHLDGQPKHNVEFWIKNSLEHPESITLSDDTLTALVKKFISFMREHHGRAEGTLDEHERHLLDNVIPYFLSQKPPQRDPNLWSVTVVQMYYALLERGLTKGQIFRCNVALRLFYEWLQNIERLVAQSNILKTLNPNMARKDEDTPLKIFLSPDQALSLIRTQTDRDHKLILLLGYFFSLRPQEIFGARGEDLYNDDDVTGLEACKAMKGLSLYDGLAIHIERQQTKKKELRKPKKNSKGWVCCFNKEAAALLVDLVDREDPSHFLIKRTPNSVYKDWPLDFAIKDTRRASLYWLGHNTAITLIQMMKHARQKDSKSLELYLRRPEERRERRALKKVV